MFCSRLQILDWAKKDSLRIDDTQHLVSLRLLSCRTCQISIDAKMKIFNPWRIGRNDAWRSFDGGREGHQVSNFFHWDLIS